MVTRATPVRIEDLHPGDVVLVSQRGRVFHATLKGRGVGGLVIEPHDKAIHSRLARPTEIIDHWVHAQRAEDVSREQLALEDLAAL